MSTKCDRSNNRRSANLQSKSTEKTKYRKMLIHEEALSLLRKCSEAKTIDEALRIITDQACVLVGGQGGSIWLRGSEDPRKIVLRWTYRPEGPNKIGESFYMNTPDEKGYYDGLTGWVFATGKPLCLKDITNKKEIKRYPHLRWRDKYTGFKTASDQERRKHFMAVPIFSCRVKGHVIGVLRIGGSKTQKAFKQFHLDLLQAISGYISGLLTNYLKTEEQRRLMERLFTVASESDLATLLRETARMVPIVIDGSYCSIFLRDQEGDFCLEATSAPHIEPYTRRNAKEHCLKYKSGLGKTGRVALTGKSIRVSGEIKSEAGISPDLCECGATSGAFLATAIGDKDCNPVGVLRVTRSLDLGQGFDGDDESLLENFSHKLHRCLTIHGYFAKGTCFVIMPFETELDSIYRTIIKPTVERFDFVCKREDEYPSFGKLTPGIISHIANASFIIADITGNNPNVYYELGIAHTLEKVVILLSQTAAPSDVRHWKYIRYTNAAGAAKEIADNMAAAIKEAVNKGVVKTRTRNKQ